MHTRHAGIDHTVRLLLVLLLAAMGSLLLAAPAWAAAYAPHAAADTITLSLDDGPTFTYGGTPAPTFTAVVTFGTKPTANYFWQVSGKLDSGQTFGGSSPTTSQDGMTMTFAHMPVSGVIPVGQHSAVATFYNPGTNMTATSNSVSLAITKATTSMDCSIDGNSFRFEGAGQTLHIRMAPSTSSQAPIDWQDATYTVTFDGPTHVMDSNLTPDGNDEVTVTAPSQIGKYDLSCAFNGTASFLPSTSAATQYTFSAMHPLGSVQLFTNPTTLAANQNLTFYIVFHAGSGLPTPTGEFTIYIGSSYYTSSIQISPAGDALVHLNPVPSLNGVNQITIQYWGDVEYNIATTNFPLTNSPIPNGGSGGSGGGSSGGNGQATPTVGGTATAQPTGTVEATPTATKPASHTSAAPVFGGDNGGLFLIVILALLILLGLGAVAVVLYMKRRGKRAPGAGSQIVGTPPAQPPAPSDEETIPVMHGDRFPSP